MFDDMDAGALAASMAVFGKSATIYPMAAPAGPNAPRTIDPARAVMADISVIRSEHAARIETGDNGMGRAVGTFRQGQQGMRHMATVAVAEGGSARVGDELMYADRPDVRYRIMEVQPDGGASITFILTRV